MKKIFSLITALTIAAAAVMPVFAENSLSAGDVNGDGKVNVTDVSLIAAQVKSKKALSDEMYARADINGDGLVNVADINMLSVFVKGRQNELWDIYAKLTAFIEENDLDAWTSFAPHIETGKTAVCVTIDGSAFENESEIPEERLAKHGEAARKRIVSFMEDKGIDQSRVQIAILE